MHGAVRGGSHSVHEKSRRSLLRWATAVLGMTSVVPLLAWVYDLGRFSTWFWTVSVPGLVLLVVIGLVGSSDSDVRTAVVLGALAGVIGTAGYDIFRVPFVLGGGYRLLSPIESYGVLLAEADSSDGLTVWAGWSYHFANGVGFGITYAALALRRHWAWGIVFAMALETGTIATPFVSDYALWDNPDAIVIAYAAHVPYGLALGFACHRADQRMAEVREVGRYATPSLLIATSLALALWLRPWSTDERIEAGRAVAAGPSAIVVDGDLSPGWLRVAPGGCVTIRNLDDRSYRPRPVPDAPELVPQRDTLVCFDDPGVVRLRISGEPFDGGFVIVDDAL